MEEMKNEYKSNKSHSTFIAMGTKNEAYVLCNGEMAVNKKVLKITNKVRKHPFNECDYIAKQLANMF